MGDGLLGLDNSMLFFFLTIVLSNLPLLNFDKPRQVPYLCIPNIRHVEGVQCVLAE